MKSGDGVGRERADGYRDQGRCAGDEGAVQNVAEQAVLLQCRAVKAEMNRWNQGRRDSRKLGAAF